MKDKKLTYKIYTLGCKVNQHDSSSLAAKLQAAGFFMEKNDADLAVINTCAVTKTALRKGRQMINRARRENPQAKILVVGCAVKIYKVEVEKWGADLVVEGNNIEQLIEKIFNFSRLGGTPLGRRQFFPPKRDPAKAVAIFKQFSTRLPASPELQRGEPARQVFNFQTDCKSTVASTDKSRYFLKVQDGCRQFCSYCIIPYARGELSSRPVAEVLAEAQIVAEAGIKEIVLCGIHLGLYGVDRITRNLPRRQAGAQRITNLTALIKELIKIKNLSRIRLSSIEVNEVTDELIDLMKKERKLCRHLHIPLQSGCDKILKLMNRPYTTKMFAQKIKKIRQLMPDIAIMTDVIVGFPGETNNDFRATTRFIKKINFSKLHVFPFSAHERTLAATLPNQVDGTVKNARAIKLNDLSCSLEKTYAERFAGKPLTVIIDGRNQGASLRGRTEYNFDIQFISEKKYRQGEVAQTENWELL